MKTTLQIMSKVKKHLFAAQNNVTIYSDCDMIIPAGKIKHNEWIGVLDEKDDFYLVITQNLFGWVAKEDCVQKKAASLKVNFSKEEPFYYAAG